MDTLAPSSAAVPQSSGKEAELREGPNKQLETGFEAGSARLQLPIQQGPDPRPKRAGRPSQKGFTTVPTPQEIREAVLRSGYLLESRLDTILRRKGYCVKPNSAYPDPSTHKSREFDLYAMKAQNAGPRDLDFVFAVLLIECVNNPQPIAFFTRKPQVPFLHHHEVKLAGLPVKVKDSPGTFISLPDYLAMDKYHHYCRGRVASQFCSFQQKKNSGEWMATHFPEQFDSFQKLGVVTEFFIDQHFKSFVLTKREAVNVEFYYPVLVVEGRLIEIYSQTRIPTIRYVESIHYEHSAFFGTEEAVYRIDVVTERFFPRYLKLVESELAKTARLMRRRDS